jgi:uncharacterized protein (UPF0548 family)
VHARILDAEQARLLAASSLTYPEVGASSRPALPAGYRHVERRVVVGHGRAVFDRASRVLLAWGVQTQAGLSVAASRPTVDTGVDALLGIGFGRLRLAAPCRVVELLDEPRRQGFRYGTLAGHPESGEESFIVELRDDELVTFTIRAFSRPATLLTRAAGPVGRWVQDRVTDRYLAALAGPGTAKGSSR